MSNRNEDFPLELDLYIGDTWISEILNQFYIPIQEQTTLLLRFRMTCFVYYRKFLNMTHNFYLNHHDMNNLCELFNYHNPHATTIIGREYIFYYYSRTISDYGQVETTEAQDIWLLERMNSLNLTASVDLPVNNPFHQAAPINGGL